MATLNKSKVSIVASSALISCACNSIRKEIFLMPIPKQKSIGSGYKAKVKYGNLLLDVVEFSTHNKGSVKWHDRRCYFCRHGRIDDSVTRV